MNDEDWSFYEDYLCLLCGWRLAFLSKWWNDAMPSTFQKGRCTRFSSPKNRKCLNSYERIYKLKVKSTNVGGRVALTEKNIYLWVCPFSITYPVSDNADNSFNPGVSGFEMVLAPESLLTTSLSKHTQQLQHNANIAPNLRTMVRPHISSTPDK